MEIFSQNNVDSNLTNTHLIYADFECPAFSDSDQVQLPSNQLQLSLFEDDSNQTKNIFYFGIKKIKKNTSLHRHNPLHYS